MEHLADVFVFPLAVPSQRDQPALTEVDLFPFYPWKTDKRAVCAHRALFCLQRPCRTTVLAVLASLTAIIMLISVCSFARRRTQGPLFVSRKLMSNKSIPSEGLRMCADTKGESDTLPYEDEFPPSPSVEVSEPSAKMLKTVLGEGGGGEAAAGPSGLVLPPKKRWKVPAKRKDLVAQAGQPDQPGPHAQVEEVGREAQAQPDVPGPSRPPDQQPPKVGSDDGTVPVPPDAPLNFSPDERSLSEMAAAHALLLLQQTPAMSGASTCEMVQLGEEAQQPFTSGEDSPHFSGPSTQAAQTQPPGAAEGPAYLDDIPAVPEFYPDDLVPPSSHSFFNVPTLQPGVVPRAFCLDRACTFGVAARYPHTLLSEVRSLLVKTSLTQEDADELVDVLERLISHCYYHQRTEVTRSDYLRSCDALAIRFLLLDAAISGFSVLGQPPTMSWWQQFAERVPHELEACNKKGRVGKRRSGHETLAAALSKALALLKTGIRPSDAAVFKLKYMIFCSPRGTERLHYSQYDSWRADCPASSGGSQEGPSGE